MVIAGSRYDGKSSALQPASLSVGEQGLLQLVWEGGSATFSLASVEVSSRLGNTPRYFSFDDGSKFETRDNDGVDDLLRHHSGSELHGWQAFLHRLESRLHYVLLALVLVVAFSWGMLKFGLPAVAEGVAYALPQDIMQSATQTTLQVLDSHYLHPSELDSAVQQRLQARFDAMTSDVESGFDYRLLFRKGGETLGANAFALPSGSIVVTDELVKIAGNDEEVVAVLAHELGHVVHRHSLRQVLQNSVLSLIVTYTTGDASSLFVALPVLFVQLGYSRGFEYEADQFAYDYLQQHRIPLHHFADILEGLEQSQTERREARRNREKGERSRADEIFEYLSTHPATEERVKRFREAG